jgi:hypothetical protein
MTIFVMSLFGAVGICVLIFILIFSDCSSNIKEEKEDTVSVEHSEVSQTSTAHLPIDPENVQDIGALAEVIHKRPVPGFINARSGRRRALCVGINYEGTSAELSGCINDAYNVRATLLSHYDFDEVLLLTDHTAALPTRKNLRRAFAWLVQGARHGDTLFLHYSGHGSHVTDRGGDELDGQDETIVPIDYKKSSQISDDELFAWLVLPLEASGARLVSLFDCCHSGSGMDLQMRYVVNRTAVSVTTERGSTKRVSPANVLFFSGCADAQTSSDVKSLSGMAYGAFTNSFLATLRETWQKPMSFRQFLLQVNRHLDSQKFIQQPQMCSAHTVDLDAAFRLLA